MDKKIKSERKLKLKMVIAIEKIKNELKNRKLKFEEIQGLFIITIKNKEVFLQIDDGENINGCWIVLSKYHRYHLCEEYISIEEFLMQLDYIILDLDKLFKLKQKINKHIDEIQKLIEDSDIYGIQLNENTFDDLSFENIISCEDI